MVGGLAVLLHGHTCLTNDVDMVVGLDEANASKAVEIVSKLGYLPRLPVDPKGFADAPQRALWIKDHELILFSFYNKDNPLLALNFYAEYPVEFDGLLSRSVNKDLGGIPVRICSLEDLITMKKMAGGADDAEDIRMLEIINADIL